VNPERRRLPPTRSWAGNLPVLGNGRRRVSSVLLILGSHRESPFGEYSSQGQGHRKESGGGFPTLGRWHTCLPCGAESRLLRFWIPQGDSPTSLWLRSMYIFSWYYATAYWSVSGDDALFIQELRVEVQMICPFYAVEFDRDGPE
jgi:hypothetical protein